MSDPRLDQLDALRDRVANDPVTTPAQQQARDKLLAEIDHERQGVVQDQALRQEYQDLKTQDDAAAPQLETDRADVIRDQKAFEATKSSLEDKYGKPLDYSKLSDADRAAYDQAYAAYSESWDRYAAGQKALKARKERMAQLVGQWMLQKLAFPELYTGSPVASPCVACLAQKIADFEKTLTNPIVWIKIIDGPGHVEGNAEAASANKGTAAQVVNAPSIPEVIALFGAGDAIQPRTVDRLGRTVKLRVKFRYARQEEFKWAAIPDDTVKYSDPEKARNYKYVNRADFLKPAPVSATTDANGVAVLEFVIGPGATTKWMFQAWDKLGGTDQTATLEAWKLVVFGEAKMTGVDAKVSALDPRVAAIDSGSPIGKIKAYLKDSNVALQLHSTKPITYRRNVPADNSEAMQNEAIGLFQAEITKFCGCFMVIIDGHGYMKYGQKQRTLLRANLTGPITFPYDNATRTYGAADIYNPNPVQSVSLLGLGAATGPNGAITFTEDSSGAAVIMTADVAALDAAWKAAGGFGDFVMVTVTYRTAEPGAAGFATPTHPAVCVSAEAVYKWRSPPTEIAAVIVHELGHQLGLATWTGTDVMATTSPEDAAGRTTAISMRSYLRNNQLDPNPNIYEARGHQGPHCHHGTALVPVYNGTQVGQDCAMFGQVQGAITWSAAGTPTLKKTYTFCPVCSDHLVRLDMNLIKMGV